MYTLTDAVKALFRRNYQPGCVVAVRVDFAVADDWLYCTGHSPVTISGTTYIPRGIGFSSIQLGDPITSKCSVTIDDTDGALAATIYDVERPTTRPAYLTLVIDGTTVATLPWSVSNSPRGRNGLVTLALVGAGGLRPRAGLETGSRDLYPFAPTPGTAFKVGSSSFVVPAGSGTPPPPPGGGWSIYDLPMVPYTDPRLGPFLGDEPPPGAPLALPGAPAQPQGGSTGS